MALALKSGLHDRAYRATAILASYRLMAIDRDKDQLSVERRPEGDYAFRRAESSRRGRAVVNRTRERFRPGDFHP